MNDIKKNLMLYGMNILENYNLNYNFGNQYQQRISNLLNVVDMMKHINKTILLIILTCMVVVQVSAEDIAEKNKQVQKELDILEKEIAASMPKPKEEDPIEKYWREQREEQAKITTKNQL